jgi:hypothetical protein
MTVSNDPSMPDVRRGQEAMRNGSLYDACQ